MKKIYTWFKNLFRIVANYDRQLDGIHKEFQSAYHEINQCRKVIKERTDLHADIHYKSPNCIIAVGRFKGRDYVQSYYISRSDFEYFIDQFKAAEKFGHMERIDSPPQFKAVFEHEFAKRS